MNDAQYQYHQPSGNTPENNKDAQYTQLNNNLQADEKERNPLKEHYPRMWKLCLIYGICYLLFAYKNIDGIGSGIFALISAVMILFIASILHKDETLPRTPNITPMPVFYLAMAVLISFANSMTDNFFFLFFNHIGSYLLFSIGCIKLFYNDREWDFGKYTGVLFIYWCQVLGSIPMPFQDFSAHRKTRKIMPKVKNPTTKYILIGILCGMPILLITTALLASADMFFSNFLENLLNLDAVFDFIQDVTSGFFENFIPLAICFFIYFLLLYLVMGALTKNILKEDVKTPVRFQAVIACTMFVMIDIVYVVFSGIQFICLFGGRLPASTYSYAEYARQGFFQLLFVALINFILVLFCNKFFSKNVALKIAMTITCVCTYVMIASSSYRMLLYIEEYHLTFLRVFVLWFILLLAFLMAGSTLSIYMEKWNSFRYSLFVFTIFYTAFALSNVDKQIAKYNIAKYEEARNSEKNPDTVFLSRYLPDGYSISKSYGAELDRLYTTYGDTLKPTDKELIVDYFAENYHIQFCNYNFLDDSTDLTLKKNAYIYDDDEDYKASVFTWKHYNFLEAKSYNLYKNYYHQKPQEKYEDTNENHFRQDVGNTDIQHLRDVNEIKDTESLTMESHDGTMYFLLDDYNGWRLVVADAAAGSRFYVMEKTVDDGTTWKCINEDPFKGQSGVAEGLLFFDENFGVAGLANASQSSSILYITRNGGISFEKIELPMSMVTELPKSAEEYGFTIADYDYLNMPEKSATALTITVTTDAVEKEGIVFQSIDDGVTWEYIGAS